MQLLKKKNIEKDPIKEEMILDLQNLALVYNETYPEDKKGINRSFYLTHGKYQSFQINNNFNDFKTFKKQALGGSAAYNSITRSSIDIKKSDLTKTGKRRYFVTAAIAGGEIDAPFFEAVQTYCKLNKASLVILPMRGVYKTDEYFSDELLEYADYFSTEYIFNTSLKARDFIINPQMIDPLTSLDRYGQKETSLIIASPKQRLNIAPIGNAELPHIIYSTGAITRTSYASNRAGRLAAQDHILGGLIVEVEDSERFYIRNVQSDSSGGFYDLNKYYKQNTCTPTTSTAFVMGDLHTGETDLTAYAAWKECIQLMKPKYIFLHDLFSGVSISHHTVNNMNLQVNKPEELDTLQKELDYVGSFLQKISNDFKQQEIIIVKSNHDLFLERYLEDQRAYKDVVNFKLVIQLAHWYMIEKKNPLEEYIRRKYKIDNVTFLSLDQDFKINRIQLGSHGHLGINGGKSSPRAIEKAYGRATTAHTHSPHILRGTYIVGTTSRLRLDYNMGPSSWLHASAIQYESGQRSMIIAFNGKWRMK